MAGTEKQRVAFMIHCMFNHRVSTGTFFNSLYFNQYVIITSHSRTLHTCEFILYFSLCVC